MKNLCAFTCMHPLALFRSFASAQDDKKGISVIQTTEGRKDLGDIAQPKKSVCSRDFSDGVLNNTSSLHYVPL